MPRGRQRGTSFAPTREEGARIALVPGWAICDGGRRYVHRSWPTRKEADAALADLLRPYPRGSPWRRLTVAWWDGREVVVTPRERQEQERAG